MIDAILDALKEQSIRDMAVTHIDITYPSLTDPYFKERAVDLYEYILIATQNQMDESDVYTLKLNQYSKLLDTTLINARLPISNQDSPNNSTASGSGEQESPIKMIRVRGRNE